jgi:glutamine amidotransferase
MKEIILIDAGTGNLRSVQKALDASRVGVEVTRTDDPRKVLSASKIVLPGVGAFGDFMKGLRARGLEEPIKEIAARGIPMLGICVGMQALFEVGEEMGTHEGLALLGGKVVKFDDALGVKIPHTGWNQIAPQNNSRLFENIKSGDYVYFNHSYFCVPANPEDIIAQTDYGITYACSVQRGNIFGVQFHPEKSQSVGLQILKNFLYQ